MTKRTKKVLLIGGALTIAGGLFAASWVYRVAGSFTAKGESIFKVWQGVTNPRGEFPGKERLTILLVGQDYNHDRHGYVYTKNVRSDTIMLLSADLDDKKLSAVSIPRDTFVEGADGKRGKINGVYARGGVELLKETLEQRFDIAVDNYLIVKPEAVKEIVNAVGGVEVSPIDVMKYDDNWGNLHVDLQPGSQRINGDQAIGFVRFREVKRYNINSRNQMVPIRGVKGSKEEGDIRRTARQQQLIRSLMASANTPGNLWKADTIISTGFSQVDTDLSRIQVLALATLFKENKGQMASATLPGTDDMSSDAYYWRLDDKRAQATIAWLLKGDTIAGRSLVRIEVSNGTKTKGLARATAETLESKGFSAYAKGTVAQTATSKVIYKKAALEETAREIAEGLGITEVVKDATEANPWEHDIEIVVGQDKVDALPSQSRA